VSLLLLLLLRMQQKRLRRSQVLVLWLISQKGGLSTCFV